MDKVTILNDSNKKITHIYHFADVHIKANMSENLQKHYTDLITKIEKKILAQPDTKTSLICICGDIIDTVYSADCIKIIKLFFNKLASMCPVIYIVGNHDLANKRNIEISDMITPLIYEFFDSEYFIYPILKAGVYQYNNVLFGLTCMGSTDVTKCITTNDKLYKNHIKVGLYHGQVSHPDMEPIIKKQCSLDIVKFKKYYDYVLLGDRHSYGYLDENKTVAYAGSLYEVNYREVDNKKGFIMWDLNDNTKTKFIEICSLIKHKVFKLTDNKIEKYDKKNLSEHLLKVKIVYDTDTKIDKLVEIEKQIKKDLNVIEFITEKDFNSVNLNTQVIIDNKQKTINDIKNYDIVIKMICDHIKEKYKPTKKMSENIDAYLKKLIKSVDFDFFEKASTFNLKKLAFSNINSYGENNMIDFTLFNNKIVEVSGPNGMGKSSILTVLLLGLYNECDIGTKYDCLNISNIDKPAIINIEFEVNGSIYKISKKIHVRNHTKRECHEDLLLYKNDVDITGQDNISTQKKITNLIGTYDNITDTNIILQRNYKAFTDLSNNDKKKIISKISKLDIFDLLAKQVRSELASVQKKGPMLMKQICEILNLNDKKEYEKFETKFIINNDILKDEIEDLNNEKNKLSKKLNTCSKSKIELEFELSKLNKLSKTFQTTQNNFTKSQLEKTLSETKLELDNLTNQLTKTDKKLSDEKYNDFENKIKKFNNDKQDQMKKITKQKELLLLKVNKIKFNKNAKEKEINNLSNQIRELEESILNFVSDDQILSNYNKWLKLKSDIESDQKQIEKTKANINIFKSKQSNVENLEHNPKCKYCIRLLNKITFEENIQILNEELDKLKENLDKNKKQFKKFDNIEDMYNKYIKSAERQSQDKNNLKLLKKDLDILKRDFDKNVLTEKTNIELNLEIDKLNIDFELIEKSKLDGIDTFNHLGSEQNKLINQIKKLADEIFLMENKIKNFDFIEKQTKLNGIIIEHTKLETKLKTINNDIASKTKSVVENDLKIKQINKIKNEMDEVQEEKQIIEYINKTLEKDGIQDTILITNIIPKLQQEINSLLTTLSNFTIEIKYLNKTLQVYKVVNKKDRILKLSGYEHMILGLCFRLVFCGLSQQKCKFVCFDEIFTFADDNGIQKIGQLFDYIRTRFDYAIIISHNDNIKKFCDISLNITKYKGFSKICFGE